MIITTNIHPDENTDIVTDSKGRWISIKKKDSPIGDVAIFPRDAAQARQFARAFRELAMILEEQEEDRNRAAA